MNTQQIQDDFKVLIKEKRFYDIFRLIKKTNHKPTEYSVRIGIKTYLDEKRSLKTRLFYIIKLLEITAINLDTNIIVDICKLMLDLGSPYTLEFFSKKTEIRDEVYNNIKGYIQKNYSNYIKDGKLVELSKLIEICKIKPSDNLVFEGYRNFLKEGNIISFMNLKSRTDIKPTKKLIFEILNMYKNKSYSANSNDSKNKEFWLKRMEKLSNATGITLDDES